MNKTTPITPIFKVKDNNIFIKRDDINYLPFGGNKVRKLELFLKDAKEKKANYIVTYGSMQSNHCRLTVSMAQQLGFKVLLILAKPDKVHYNGNFLIYDLYDTQIVWTETSNVPETINETVNALRNQGHTPYFIQGGGHGDIGTHAYKLAFDEILMQEDELNISFSHIFHASGTGTTQAGLIAGNIINRRDKQIIGVSIARNKVRGLEVIEESVQSYLKSFAPKHVNTDTIHFIDEYIGEGYADVYSEVVDTIKEVIKNSGIILDPVYTGKAFYGMMDYIEKNGIKGKDILFIHTGGIPLLFNYANEFKRSN